MALNLDVLKELLDERADDDPLEQLAELGRDVRKRRTRRDVTDVPVDDMQADPDYQRPIDRDKVASMVKRLQKGEDLGPGKANVRPDGSTWITDGQHRVAAHAMLGRKTCPMVLTQVEQQDEPQETNLIAKIAADDDTDAQDRLAGVGARRVGKRLVVSLGAGGTVTYLPHHQLVGDAERGTLTVTGSNDARQVVERLGLPT